MSTVHAQRKARLTRIASRIEQLETILEKIDQLGSYSRGDSSYTRQNRLELSQELEGLYQTQERLTRGGLNVRGVSRG